MHVGLVSDQYPPYPIGGIGARVTGVASGLVERGHRVTVVGVYPRNRGLARRVDEVSNGVRVVRLPAAPGWMRWRPGLLWERFHLSRELARLHKEAPFDLVEYTDGFGWAMFGAPAGVPCAIRIEGTMKLFDEVMGISGGKFVYWLEAQGLKRAHALSALSEYARRETLRTFNMPGRECAILHNAVDVDLFSPGNGEIEPRLVVFVNSIEPRKGVQELIIAMNSLFGDHPDARLALVGSDTVPLLNGRTYSDRVLDALDPAYRGRVTFAGRLDRETGVLEYLRKAAVCCYASRTETFGVAPLEAMAVGRPVIYYNQGPGPELIEDGVSGLLCDPGSPEAIAEKIRLVFDNPAYARSLGARARERAVSLFSKGPWIDKNLEYYRACITKGATRQADV